MRKPLVSSPVRGRCILILFLLVFLLVVCGVFYKEIELFSEDGEKVSPSYWIDWRGGDVAVGEEEIETNDGRKWLGIDVGESVEVDRAEPVDQNDKLNQFKETVDVGDGDTESLKDREFPKEDGAEGKLEEVEATDLLKDAESKVESEKPQEINEEVSVGKAVDIGSEIDKKLEDEESEKDNIKQVEAHISSSEYPNLLTCTAKDLPDGWPTPDSPLVLGDLGSNICNDMERCTLPHRKYLERKNSIMKPVRFERLEAELAKLNPIGGTIILTLLNFGYAFLFANFVCGCESRGIEIRNSMIVISTDEQGYNFARKLGFAAVFTDWILEDYEIDSKAPENFSKGDYFWLAGMMNVFLADIHSFGYNVLIQDADVTWRYDPRPYLHRPEAAEFDIQAMSDGASSNRDKKWNGGFLWYRNNCKTRAFLSSLENIVEWILFTRSDQAIINRLLQDPHFEGINVHTLDTEKFLNGNRWDPWRMKPNRPLPLHGMVWHASWTHNHFLKMTKLLVVGEWHIASCRWYNRSIIPDFDFKKEFGKYGKDEVGHVRELIEVLMKPRWKEQLEASLT